VTIPAHFWAATGPIAGSIAAQNLLSLTNPAAGTKTVLPLRLWVSAGVVAAVGFSYAAGRTSGPSTAGTVLTAGLGDSALAASGIVRLGPTATMGAGLIWSGSPGLTGQLVQLVPVDFDRELQLNAGQSLLVMASANDLTLTHFVSVSWCEE